MTPKEIQATTRALQEEIGSKAEVSPSIVSHGQPCRIGIWPFGLTGEGCFFLSADDWPELFAKAHAEWAGKAAAYNAELIERMALAIISITARTGWCSEGALRADFDSAEIKRCGAAAVEKANAMAANGPFSIELTANSNAPEAA